MCVQIRTLRRLRPYVSVYSNRTYSRDIEYFTIVSLCGTKTKKILQASRKFAQ